MNIKTALLAGAGILLLLLGLIGVFLPVLPTTPFVIAAAGCLASTPRLQARIMGIPFFREYITNYRERRGLTRRTVVKSLASLWVMLSLSAILSKKLWLALLLLGVGAGVTAHILSMARPKRGANDDG